jgi:hypothetical protein
VVHFELESLRDFPDEGPVAMLNLVKFRERSLHGNGSGRDACRRCTEQVGDRLEQLGGQVLWASLVEHPVLDEGGDIEWDWSVLVRYPSWAAFIEMVTHPDYLKANIDRANGVEKHVILASRTVLGPAMSSQ